MPTSTLAQMAVPKARVSLPSRLRKTRAVPLLSSMATIGKVGHSRCVKTALQVHPVGLVVAEAEASEVASELVEASAAVADSVAGVVDTVVAMVVGEGVTAEEGLAEAPGVAMKLLVHPFLQTRSRIMPVLAANAVRSSMSAM